MAAWTNWVDPGGTIGASGSVPDAVKLPVGPSVSGIAVNAGESPRHTGSERRQDRPRGDVRGEQRRRARRAADPDRPRVAEAAAGDAEAGPKQVGV